MGTSPLRDTPLYNSRIIDTYLKLVRQRYPQLDVPLLLRHAQMESYQVADQGHWFRQEQVDRFYEKLVQMTGNPNIGREAGRYAASPDALGAMRQYVLGLTGVANAFERISRITANFTRSSVYLCRKISSRKVEIVVKPLEDGLERRFQCENRLGFFEAMVLGFSHALPTIEHPECLFEGGRVCRYLIGWEKERGEALRVMVRILVPALCAVNLALAAAGRFGWLSEVFPVSLIVALSFALVAERGRARQFLSTLNGVWEANEKLVEQINLNYNNALLANEIGRALGSYSSVEQMLADVAQVMQRRLDYDRGLILLADRDRARLEFAMSYGYAKEEIACLKAASFALTQPDSPDVYVTTFSTQSPVLIDSLGNLEETIVPRTLPCSAQPANRSFICCPIVTEGVSVGVLAVERLMSKRALVESDKSLILGTAAMIGISLRNCELIGDLQRAKEELEKRVAARTEDLLKNRGNLELKNRELETTNRQLEETYRELAETYRELEEEASQRLKALEQLRDNERMLIQQSRLAALGEMISNIAHQWRQPLNELGLIVQELPMMYARDQMSEAYLKQSVASCMKVLAHLSRTIDDFRNFFRPDREKVGFSVREAVDRALSLVVESFRHQEIRIEVQATGDPIVVGYPNEFSQALLNILLNARDAFLEREIPGPRVVVISYAPVGGRTVLTVADNAGGIPPEILERIFDPYFTTRGPEQGTGIGLYMSKTIVEKNLNGRLSVANVGSGAEFRIEV